MEYNIQIKGRYKQRKIKIKIINKEGNIKDIEQKHYGKYNGELINGIWTTYQVYVVIQVTEDGLIQQRKNTLYKDTKGYYITICNHKIRLDKQDVEQYFLKEEKEK